MTIPLPTNQDTVRKRIQTWDRARSQGQRLTSARVGSGGVRIYGDGKMTVGGGANLIIIDGDLKLGDSAITGDMLKGHLALESDIATSSQFSLTYDKWTTVAGVSFEPPIWANQAVVNVYVDALIGVKRLDIGGFYVMLDDSGATTRVSINDQNLIFDGAPVQMSRDEKFVLHPILPFTTAMQPQKIDISFDVYAHSFEGHSYWNEKTLNNATLSASVYWIKESS